MNKTAIKNFAVWARVALIEAVKQRAYEYAITEGGANDPALASIGGRLLTATEREQRRALIGEVEKKGYAQAMEEAAYTWFNRFIALRFMEVNGYLPSRVRVFTNSDGEFRPEILKEAANVEIDGLDREKVIGLLDSQDNEGLYKYLIITQCNALGVGLPGMFGKIADRTELLFPANLLRDGSVIDRMVSDIPEDDWRDAVQIIGWLYQYYNDERKNQVISIYKGNVKKEDIPAATQLFTTDWVVRYMVDNSLGRYWIERHPESTLSDKLEFLVTPKNSEIRHIDDCITPEEITFFDPCMGSGHVLVYAFDVLLEIYKECGYSERDAAGLIVKNNLFGLDIDNRAAQLAYLAIMMKARSYDRRFLNREIQPNVYAIQESNDIDISSCGEINTDPGMKEISQYLIDTFRDAKELGSIIVADMKDYDSYISRLEACGVNGQLTIDDSDWMLNIRPTMITLAQQAKVFAKEFTVVCTNPPYLNKTEGRLKSFVTEKYKDYSGDLFSVFIYRNLLFCKQDGYCGYMTPFVWMFIKTYEKLRELIILNKGITTLVQMEYSAFEEATVPICSFVLKNGKATENGLYFKLSDFKGGMEVQKQKVLEALADKNCGYFYEADQSNFSKIPGSPVAYWVSEAFSDIFEASTVADYGFAGIGMRTGDNELFLRLWHEIFQDNMAVVCHNKEEQVAVNKRWIPYNKGGDFRKWYGNNEYVVNWFNNGEEIKENTRKVYPYLGDNLGWKISNESFYYMPGITWSGVTSSKNSFRAYGYGFIFDSGANGFFPDDISKINVFTAYLNSCVSQYVLNIINPTINTGAGTVKKIPIIISDNLESVNEMERLADENVNVSKKDWNSYETSWDFKRNPMTVNSVSAAFGAESGDKYATSLKAIYLAWKSECNERFMNLKSNEEALNRIFIDIYGLQDELTPEVADRDVTVHRVFDTKDDVPESMKGSAYVRTMRDEIVSLISYAVGCMFGRYSVDADGLAYAGGEWDAGKYRTVIPEKDNIIPICDDEYFNNEMTALFVNFVRKVYGEDTLEANLKFIADALGGKGTPREVIRSYFLNDFYADHLKTYQKRPIYWLFDSGKKNGFKALIYLHRYRSDTVACLRTDYVHELQERYGTQMREADEALRTAAPAERVKLTKRLEKLRSQAAEIKEYEEKIHHLADMMIPLDLDDGVKVNYAKFGDVLAKIK